MGCLRRSRGLRSPDRGEVVCILASLGSATTITHLIHGSDWPHVEPAGWRVATYNADVYVFCVQTSSKHEEYDPLDISQWDFYVLPRQQVAALNCKSVGLSTLAAAAGPPVRYAELASVVDRAWEAESDAERQPDDLRRTFPKLKMGDRRVIHRRRREPKPSSAGSGLGGRPAEGRRRRTTRRVDRRPSKRASSTCRYGFRALRPW